VRTWVTNLALVLLLLASPGRADVFDEPDGKEPKKADAKGRGDGADAARHEQELWEAYVKKLGDGPIYRVEVLYRGGPGADHLTYCRHYVSAAIPTPHGLFGFGVNAKGEAVPPADPGHQAVTPALEARKSGKSEPPPPLATRTRYVGVTLDQKGSKPDDAAIQSSDHVMFLPLPKKGGESQTTSFGGALFRLERVTAEDVRKAGPLRQDAKLFRARVDALRREVLSASREHLPHSEVNLIGAAHVIRAPELIDGVRALLDEWIANPPSEFLAEPFPFFRMVDCLGALGDERDFTAFRGVKQRLPRKAESLIHPTLKLVERVGAAKAMPLIEDLLKNPTPLDADGRIRVLRELDPRIPPFTEGDYFLIAAVWHFRLKATCYELRPVEPTLDALRKKKPLTPEQELMLATCHLVKHMFLTEAGRRQGVELVLDWFKQYQPPANK
jgi:hypothetical protein